MNNERFLRNSTISTNSTIPTNGVSVRNIASCYNHGCQNFTRIPKPTQLSMSKMTPPSPEGTGGSKDQNIVASIYVERWKNRYEESERKNKGLMVRNEKARRENDDLQRRYNKLEDDRAILEAEFRDRDTKLNKLRQLSEKVYKEYEELKNRHDVDTGVMQRVMQQAGEWYKQNRQLKRQSTVLMHAVSNSLVDFDYTDATDTVSESSSNDELEFLKQTVCELSARVAGLQTELNAVRLQEFEATELNVNLAQELESEKELRQCHEKDLEELRTSAEQNERVSKLLIEELTALKQEADHDKEKAQTFKSEAYNAKKRVTILTHQSALLMGDLEIDERLMMLLQEVDNLKSSLENQNVRHMQEMDQLQEQLAEKNESDDSFLWEEKLKMAEEDLRKAVQRAELAEKRLADSKPLVKRKNSVLSRVSNYENQIKSRNVFGSAVSCVEMEDRGVNTDDGYDDLSSSTGNISTIASESASTSPSEDVPPPSPPAPPVAPPLPPPPPPAPPTPPPASAISDMATLLGLKANRRDSKRANGGGAIDEIVNQIKGGKFQLKATGENFMERKTPKEEPEAVKEMLNILGTLRKRRGVTRQISASPKSNQELESSVAT